MSSDFHYESTNFSPQALKDLRAIFNQLDQDKDGVLNREEFRKFLEQNEIDPRYLNAIFAIFGSDESEKNEEIKKIIEKKKAIIIVDPDAAKESKKPDATIVKKDDNDETILMRFENFLAFFDACIQTEKNPRYFFKLIFEHVDANQDGVIDIDEMMDFTELCGNKLTREQVQSQLRAIDKNSDNLIDFDELYSALLQEK